MLTANADEDLWRRRISRSLRWVESGDGAVVSSEPQISYKISGDPWGQLKDEPAQVNKCTKCNHREREKMEKGETTCSTIW